MRKICLSIALATGLAGTIVFPAFGASERDTVARKFGEAFALAERCPAVSADETRMGKFIAALGIRLDDGFKAVSTIWKNRTLTELHDTSDADACALAHLRYGASGTEGQGILIEN